MDQRHRADECSQQPHAVDLDRDTELEQGELQIDRVPAEAIRARADDHGGGGIPAFCKRQDCHLQPFSFSCKTESRFQIATLSTRQQGSAFNPGPDEITESNRHESRYIKSMHQKVLLTKKYLLLFLLAFGLVVFVPQKSRLTVTLAFRSDRPIATLILYTTVGIIRATTANTITTIIRTSMGTGTVTVIGTTMTMTMIKPKRFSA